MRQSSIVFLLLSSVAFWGVSYSYADVYTVTNTNADGAGSLLQCAIDANNHAGFDSIIFNIGDGGPAAIQLTQTIVLTDSVSINGATQSGFSNDPIITLTNTASATTTLLMQLGPNSSGSQVENLNFQESGQVPEAEEIFSIDFSNNNLIESCNILGDPNQSPFDEGLGLKIVGDGSATEGVNNFIHHCMIGNCTYGIVIEGIHYTSIADCAIGTSFDGSVQAPIAADGIDVHAGAERTLIGAVSTYGGNQIANCGLYGVYSEVPDTLISKNSIYDCGLGAIITASPLPAPILNSPDRSDGRLRITVTHNGVEVDKNYSVEFFADAPKNEEGVGGQEKTYLGGLTITTNASPYVYIINFPDNGLIPPSAAISATISELDGSYTSNPSDAIVVTSGPDPGAPIYDETAPDQDAAWVPSGLDSGPENTSDPDSPDDVDITKLDGAIGTIVRPSEGRYRIAGWNNPSLVNTDAVGDGNVIRGKFYIYTSNPATDPVNAVPDFRIRLDNEGADLASNTYGFSQTGTGGTELNAREPFYAAVNNPDAESRMGDALRPSSDPSKPSLYRIDFLPIKVPAAAHTNIGGTFESYATQNGADGTIALTQLTLATYPATIAQDSAEILSSYQNYSSVALFLGANDPSLQITSGAFNAENDFQPGRLQTIDVPGEVSDDAVTKIVETQNHSGTTMDTLGVPDDKFGVGIFTIGSNDHAKTPRLEQNKVYVASFVVTSDMHTISDDSDAVVQSGMAFQVQTALGGLTSRLELSGPVNASAPESANKSIISQSLPGQECQDQLPFGSLPNGFSINSFFPPGENGGVYTVIMPSPLDPDIRADNGGNLGNFATEPGPGVNADSVLDITYGINVISNPRTLRLSPDTVVPFTQPNRTKIRIIGAVLGSFDQIDDGGYAY